MWSVYVWLRVESSGGEFRNQLRSCKRARRTVLLHGVIFVGLEIKTSCYMSLVHALAIVTVIRHPIRPLYLLIWPVRRSHVFQHFVSTYSACHTLCGFFTPFLGVRVLISRVTVSLDDCMVPNYRLVVHWLDVQEFKSSRIITYSLLKFSLCPRVALTKRFIIPCYYAIKDEYISLGKDGF
jgi:hypothetical protein